MKHILVTNTKNKIFFTATMLALNLSASFWHGLAWGQSVGINVTGALPDASAMLDISSSNKGLLIPRVALTATNSNAPVGAGVATSLLVYNTATAGTPPSNVVPGYYYWDGTKWVSMGGSSGGGNGWLITGNSGTTAGTNFVGTTDNKAFDIRTNNIVRTRITTKGQIETYNTGESVFVGEGAGANDDLSGNKNVYVGYQAGMSGNSGYYNVAIGHGALKNITTGNNVAVGMNALGSSVTGDGNTALGYGAFSAGAGFGMSMALGAQAIAITASFQVRVGDPVFTSSIGGRVAWSVISDARFKKDVKETVPGLAFITKLRPVTYHMDMDELAAVLKTPDSLRPKEGEVLAGKVLHTGFIAQEVEKAAQELGFDFSGVDKPKNANDYYCLRYASFTVPLVKAVQELASQNTAQQKEIENLKSTIEKIIEQNTGKSDK